MRAVSSTWRHFARRIDCFLESQERVMHLQLQENWDFRTILSRKQRHIWQSRTNLLRTCWQIWRAADEPSRKNRKRLRLTDVSWKLWSRRRRRRKKSWKNSGTAFYEKRMKKHMRFWQMLKRQQMRQCVTFISLEKLIFRRRRWKKSVSAWERRWRRHARAWQRKWRSRRSSICHLILN